MGTRFEVALFGKNFTHLQAAGEAALDEVEFLNDRLDLFKPHSFLSHLNRWAFEKPVRLDPDLFALIELCLGVHKASEGAFDVTVGPLMAQWGFRGKSGDAPVVKTVAGDMKKVGSDKIELDRASRTIRFKEAGMALDLNAVAKGFALDRAADVLREAGIERALLHGGTSTVLALGTPPDAPAWTIGVEDPDGTRRGLLKVVHLAEGALSVSSPLSHCAETAGRVRGHLMDPRIGAPVSSKIRLAAVKTASATLSDAWSTALGVGGIDLLKKIGNSFPQVTGLVVAERSKGCCCEMAGPETYVFKNFNPVEKFSGEKI